MSEIVLVGGAGYIGTRLQTLLNAQGQEFEVVDPGILNIFLRRQNADALKIFPIGKTVVWLASIHELREGDLEEDWRVLAQSLMVSAPLAWAQHALGAGGKFIYVSSMRAETAPERLYGKMKLRAERKLLALSEDVTVVRPGTVWGGLAPGRPNRVHTLVNRLLLEPDLTIFPGQEPFYTTHMPRLVGELERLIRARRTGIMQCTDYTTPTNGALMKAGHRPRLFDMEAGLTDAPAILAEKTQHPMDLYAEYYNIPCK